mgnify:CR=1 FL=1
MKKVTLVLGASLKENRYSHKAIKKLKANGIAVVGLGAVSGVVDNVIIESEKKLFKNIDTVTLYLNPKRQELYYEYIIDLQPRRVIFNPGTENLEFVKLLKENTIETKVACTLVLLNMNTY